MAAPILDVRQICSGEQGEVWATLPDGRRMCMMHVINIESKVDRDKQQLAILGKRGKANRTTGETYSGTMEIYTVETVFLEMAEQFKNTGKDFYFDLQIINDDSNTDLGSKIVTLLDCNMNNFTLSKLDADSSVLTESIEFTFEDYRIDKPFNVLDGLF